MRLLVAKIITYFSLFPVLGRRGEGGQICDGVYKSVISCDLAPRPDYTALDGFTAWLLCSSVCLFSCLPVYFLQVDRVTEVNKDKKHAQLLLQLWYCRFRSPLFVSCTYCKMLTTSISPVCKNRTQLTNSVLSANRKLHADSQKISPYTI